MKIFRTGRLVISSIILTSCLVGSIAAADDPGEIAFFQKEIAPILEQRCFECHSHESGKAKGGLVLDSRSGWDTGGGSGSAIVPGEPEESLLVEAIRRKHEDLEMPPKEKLPASEIALLEKWIAMGAPDPRESKAPKIDPAKLWALQPIEKQDPPTPANEDWARDDIDHFILAGLEEAHLSPAPDADRYTLLRRVTFDLTGLPATPGEIEAFINDPSDTAYQKVVDRLLASTAFGDHWARHWFDLSCYADLAGIGGKTLIRDAWRYRDYVIAALNDDKPFDRFIHEQIAGDHLPYETIEQQREQIIATGYLAIGPYTISNYIKKQLDADVVDHQIDRIGRTFLGQTISCARCHDHKFDPVPTADYYALAGIFHSTLTTSYDGPGVWSTITEIALPNPKGTLEERAHRAQKLKAVNSKRQRLQAERTSLVLKIPGASTANVLTLDKRIATNKKDTDYDLRFEAGPSVWAGAPQRTTAADGLQIDLLRADGSVLTGFRHNPGPWSGTKDAQKLKPVRFSYTGDGSGDLRIRLTSATPGSGHFGGAIDDLRILHDGDVLFEEDFDEVKPGKTESSQADTRLRVLAKAGVPGWSGDGINHSHVVDLGEGDFAVQFFGGREESFASAKPVTEAEISAHTRAMELDDQLQAIASEITALEKKDAPEKALAIRDVDSPADSPIYQRGNFQSLGEISPRGFLSAVPVSTNYDIPSDSSGRLQLAHWLTDSENPLTSRVLVNRAWHHLFGKGLVRSVDYFGVHGETPSHPELLDFLALRFREKDKWSLKRTVRHMVLSRTYQMASSPNAEASQFDPSNQLLWQMPRRRLSAESLRDAMLAVSGQLDPARSGPSLGLELKGNLRGLGGKVNLPTWGGKIPDYVKNRRSVYLPLKRERPVGELEILSIFDFPHPSEITGARANTTVATQALFLMNGPLVKQQAEKLAQRITGEVAEDERARVERLYLLTLGRPATDEEIEMALAFLDQSEGDFEKEARNKAWTQLCHAVLGSNQFLFRE